MDSISWTLYLKAPYALHSTQWNALPVIGTQPITYTTYYVIGTQTNTIGSIIIVDEAQWYKLFFLAKQNKLETCKSECPK